jgi:hypothetical protein
MSVTEHRVDTIGIRLHRHFKEIGTTPVMIRGEEWEHQADTLHAPFGYRRPYWRHGQSYSAFCPSLIERTTRHLGDRDLDNYLICVELQIDYYIINHTMDDDKASEWFDNFMADNFLRSLELLNQVQMNWLDRMQALG